MMRKTTLFSMLFIGVLVGMLVIPKGANAVAFSLVQSDLLNMTQIDDDPAGCCNFFGLVTEGAGVQFNEGHDSTIGGSPTQQRIGLSGTDVPLTNLSAFTTFDMRVINDNDDDWEYRLWIASGADALTLGSGTTSAYTFIPPGGGEALLSLVLAGLTDDTDITGIGLDIRMSVFSTGVGILGCDTKACSGETIIAVVPEPATVLLLGSGLLGLLGIRRRRAA